GHVAGLDPAGAAALDAPGSAAERGLARTWWRDLRALKEDLSESASCRIAVPGTDHSVLVGRDELEALVRGLVSESVDELERTLAAAGGSAPSAVLLCGDASRMPIVDRLVRRRFAGVPVRSAEDPKGVVALGAVAAASADRRARS